MSPCILEEQRIVNWMKKKIGGVSSSMKARGAPRESLENATIVEIRNTRDTDSVFRYEPFGIFPVFSYRILFPKEGGGFGPLLYTSPSHHVSKM